MKKYNIFIFKHPSLRGRDDRYILGFRGNPVMGFVRTLNGGFFFRKWH